MLNPSAVFSKSAILMKILLRVNCILDALLPMCIEQIYKLCLFSAEIPDLSFKIL